MASRYELEVTLSSARDLKNVNWRHGPVRPYAVVWVDPSNKCSTKVDDEGDTSPIWDQTLVIPLPPGPIEDATLYIDVVHAGSDDDIKPLIGSARLKLRDYLDEAGFGAPFKRSLQLKRPSGRPHGKVEVKVCVREPRYRAADPYHAPPYGVPPATREYAPPASREYAPPAYASPYAPTQPSSYYGTAAAAPAGGYPYGGYNAPPQPQYGQPSYGQAPQYGYGGEKAPAYGQYGQQEEKKSKFGGMGTGLAVGAVAGALGGLALAEGFDHLEDNIADDAAEKVEDDLGYDEDDF